MQTVKKTTFASYYLESPMGIWSAYNINFLRLAVGKHHFDYQIDDEFFSESEYSLVKKCSTTTHLELNKVNQGLLELNFLINGNLFLECDRCLELLPYPMTENSQVIVKLENIDESPDDDLIYLSPDAFEINVAQIIYDFHQLAIPFRKECQQINERCDEIENYLSSSPGSDDSDEVDPRWDGLKKLL